MKLHLLLLSLLAASAPAAETTVTATTDQKGVLYTPTDQPIEGKTYWLAIGINSLNSDGKGAGGLEKWVADDVIALGPSFLKPKVSDTKAEPKADTTKTDPATPEEKPAEAVPPFTQEDRLNALIAEVGKTWKIHPRVFLHGFSEGAQVVHQFAMKHPEMVAGVSIASEGSWNTSGFGEINPAASNVPFAISCGQYDREKPGKQATMGRLEWMEAFTRVLQEAHFDVVSRIIPNAGHKITPDTMAFAKTCFQRARATHFSRTVMIACDFNEVNPLWSFRGAAAQSPAGRTTTAHAAWESDAGVIEKAGTSERTGALNLQVNSPAKAESWSGTLSSGLLPVTCPEQDLNKLTLAFDLSASSARTVRVLIESYNVSHERTGGREAFIYPAAPDDFHRHVLDLGSMKAAGAGEFNAADPIVQISLTISHELGWTSGAFHQLRLDNLSYAAPAFYVSPTGKDSTGAGTVEKPLATINKALGLAQPGDIILLMEGTFVRKNEVANFVRAGSPAAWITVKNHPGQKPVLTSPHWNLIKIGKGEPGKPSSDPALAYLEVRGLTIHGVAEEVEAKYKADVGKSKPATNGNGLSVDGRYSVNKPHHIRIADNEVLQCPGGGISVIHADYAQVENNVAHNNCHWTIYASSGISLYQAFNFDTSTGGHKMLVRHNVAHHNYCTQPWIVTGKPSDGNGIIVDDMRNHQNNSPNGVYHGGVLIQGNLTHDNGGSGMHSYASDHIDFINNTSANNSTINDYGQLSVTACGHVRVLNNILVAAADKPMNRVNGDFHDVLISHNLFHGGNKEIVPGDNALQADPLFKDAAKGDFHLSEKSPAKAAGGAWEIAPLLDLQQKAYRVETITLGALAP